ncbi:hypothetical protein AMTRI_Chr09g42230 [Amborella trichopoda]
MPSPPPKAEKTEQTHDPPNPPLPHIKKWPPNLKKTLFSELKQQSHIGLPILAMNLMWFTKLIISTAFLGHLGPLNLAGGALGLTFANVTGFSVLSGLTGAMEPICGQAFGARNHALLNRTLVLTIFFLLLASLPISYLWLNAHKILIFFGQDHELSNVARVYLVHLLPDLIATSLLCPLRAYLSSQCQTLSIMICSAIALAFHIPLNVFVAHSVQGVALVSWWTDLNAAALMAAYAATSGPWLGGWWRGRWQWVKEFACILRLAAPCCLMTCLEWWCYELLMMLTGRLPNARQSVATLAIVLNADYVLYSVMLSLATCASVRVANELGAGHHQKAYEAMAMTLGLGVFSGWLGCVIMVSARGLWGSVFSHNREVVRGVKRMMPLMAALEVFNFPQVVCGGVLRATATPGVGMWVNLAGFYVLALPLGAWLGFGRKMGLRGVFFGFLVGVAVCAFLMVTMVLRIDWVGQACRAQEIVGLKGKGDEQSDRLDVEGLAMVVAVPQGLPKAQERELTL